MRKQKIIFSTLLLSLIFGLMVITSGSSKGATAQLQEISPVPNHPHPPTVDISRPDDNQLYVADQTVLLEGTGYDAEGRSLKDSQLTWASDLNGPLGSGHMIINAMKLKEGTHRITLTATDSTGQIGSESVSIKVFRERPILPPTLSVAPGELGIRVATGQTETRTLGIRNTGDGDLTWSASTDQPWIHLASTTGSTPYNLDITIDATGLVVCKYDIGHVTIKAVGAADSPQVVTVYAQTPSTTPAPKGCPTITID